MKKKQNVAALITVSMRKEGTKRHWHLGRFFFLEGIAHVIQHSCWSRSRTSSSFAKHSKSGWPFNAQVIWRWERARLTAVVRKHLPNTCLLHSHPFITYLSCPFSFCGRWGWIWWWLLQVMNKMPIHIYVGGICSTALWQLRIVILKHWFLHMLSMSTSSKCLLS